LIILPFPLDLSERNVGEKERGVGESELVFPLFLLGIVGGGKDWKRFPAKKKKKKKESRGCCTHN